MKTFALDILLAALAAAALALAPAQSIAAPKSKDTTKAAAQSDTNRFVFASWNTENLFDPDDDPDNEGDDEYTPEEWTRWTPARYELKLKHIAKVVAAMKPDAMVFTEIENFRVMRDLRDAVKAAGWDMPYIIHKDGPDKRGIDNAMLSRHKPESVEWLSPTPFQRLVLIAQFDVGGRKITLCGNHWKSYYGDLEAALATRTIEAHAVREEVEKRLAAEPSAALICTGDFNDGYDAPILVDEAGFSTNLAAVVAGEPGHVLYNLASGRNKKEVRTYYYARKNRWDSFDTMSVSPGMLEGAKAPAPWKVAVDPENGRFRYEVFRLPEMCNADNGAPIPFRRITRKTGVEVLSGFSDHFPIRVELEAR